MSELMQGKPRPGGATIPSMRRQEERLGVPERPVIETRGLRVWYGSQEVLKGIDLRVQGQRITALIGPSGCGKTTFLRSLDRMNDLIPAARIGGEVLLEGENIYGPEVDVVDLRRRVGMVFQRPNPFPMSVYDNVAYGVRLHRMASRGELDLVVEHSLQRAALWDEVRGILGKSALTLSGGQQQRLCIARTLAVQPEVLLMDEPASALDPISTLRIEELMRELKQTLTIVIVTHNMQQAARISDETGFFLGGELIEFGASERLFTKPQDLRTEDYITGRFG